jgi:hypothetical protein
MSTERPQHNQSVGNKVATYIARAVICLFGVGLLITFVAFKIWKTADFKMWMTFGALIGLCIGYGLGGDIWGARLFDLFTGSKSRRYVEKDGERPAFVFPKAALLILLVVLVLLLALLVRFVWYKP